jgi:hypothetical protein
LGKVTLLLIKRAASAFFENFKDAVGIMISPLNFSIRFTFRANRLKNGGCRFAGRFHL